jgi:hypothetical protein
MQRVTFTNPANGDTYEFATNPEWDAETQQGTGYQEKVRQIERTSNTGNIGATRQQGDDGAFILNWQFAIYSAAQEQAMWSWYELSGKQSIYLTDFDGEEYEGQLTTVGRMRQGAAGGPQDTNSRGFYAIYVVQFEVWVFRSGMIATAGVNT